jgi:murein DD-endopeptidase MepM/ murein hydrolase activator NlpD
MMSRKKAWLASSLAICSTSTAWVVGTGKHPVLAAEDYQQQRNATLSTSTYAQDVIYRYLNPITVYVDGNLAAKVETKPLTYQVKKGDTLSHIGARYGIHYHRLATYNQIGNPDLLNVGQILSIPLTRKWIRLKWGDTMESLVQEYHTSAEVMLELNPSLKEPNLAYVGQLVAVPQEVESPPKWVGGKEKNIRLVVGPVVMTQPKMQPKSYMFSWPVKDWNITSHFGWRNGRQHKGIDIVCSHRKTAEVYAALDGFVKTVKYGKSGYGYYVIVDHGDGWETLYSHLKGHVAYVKQGEQVQVGQVIGLMGDTGNARGVHLHFEIRHQGIPIDPLSKLGN